MLKKVRDKTKMIFKKTKIYKNIYIYIYINALKRA